MHLFIPVNPLTGVETNDDWVAWLTVILIYLISETQFCLLLIAGWLSYKGDEGDMNDCYHNSWLAG